jgi:MYXO-CTERM domain-containing protein
VSCTRFRSASQYWDTEISVSGAGAERTWKVVGKMPEISGAGGKQSGTLRVIGIVLAAAGLFALGMLWGGRRRRPASGESEPA